MYVGGTGSSDGDKRKRSRVFIDPLTEIPRLERWFNDDTHPSAFMIEQYTEELNRCVVFLFRPIRFLDYTLK